MVSSSFGCKLLRHTFVMLRHTFVIQFVVNGCVSSGNHVVRNCPVFLILRCFLFRRTFVIPSSYLRHTIANTSVKLERNEYVQEACRRFTSRSFLSTMHVHTFAGALIWLLPPNSKHKLQLLLAGTAQETSQTNVITNVDRAPRKTDRCLTSRRK